MQLGPYIFHLSLIFAYNKMDHSMMQDNNAT